MTDELKLLIETTRSYKVSPQELKEQAISFAYGNGRLSNEKITREGVARAYERHRELDQR